MNIPRSTLLTVFVITLLICVANDLFGQQQKTHFDGKPYIEGEFLVQLNSEGDIGEIISGLPGDLNAENAGLLSGPMNIWLIRFDHEKISHEKMQELLYSISGVNIADYNYRVELRSSLPPTLPNDPNFLPQWHHVNTGQTSGIPDADIDSDLAWDITTGGLTDRYNDEIVVCIIESVNLTHADLDPNRWVNSNEIPNNSIDDDGNGYVDDYLGWNTGTNDDNIGTGGHGTSVAGMIGAKGDNGLGITGINWNVKLMVVNGPRSTQAQVITAYTYPLIMRQLYDQSNGSQGAFVVATNASWGIDYADPLNYPLWCAMYDTLGKYGILNCGATTNLNLDVDIVGDMPTGCASPYMIGVGRSGHNDTFAGGYGANTIDFAAPGISVYTTKNTNSYGTSSGTSFASPLTAGVIALMYSIPCSYLPYLAKSDPQQAADWVREALRKGVEVKPAFNGFFETNGRLNAKNAIDSLMLQTCGLCIPVNVNPVVVNETCSGSADGSIALTFGNAPFNYTYSWNTGDSLQAISGLQSGTYTVQISDSASCDTTITISVGVDYQPVLTVNHTDVTCYGAGDGTAIAGLSGGVAPYLYHWPSIGSMTDSVFNLGPGTYIVEATDSNGCMVIDSVTIMEPQPDTVSFMHSLNGPTLTIMNNSSAGNVVWTFGNGDSSFSISPVYTYQSSGTFDVCLHLVTNCIDTTSCIQVTVTQVGLPESDKGGLVTISYSASGGLVNFSLHQTGIGMIEVFDIRGSLIERRVVSASVETFNITSWGRGLYYYRILDPRSAVLDRGEIPVLID